MPNANASTTVVGPSPAPSAAVRMSRAALFGAALAALAFLFGGAHVPCGFAWLCHLPCPGCGSTRSMLALASGNLHDFARYNPLAPLMAALAVVLALQAMASVLATGTFQRVGDGKIGLIVSRGVLVVSALEVILWLARFGGLLGGPVPV